MLGNCPYCGKEVLGAFKAIEDDCGITWVCRDCHEKWIENILCGEDEDDCGRAIVTTTGNSIRWRNIRKAELSPAQFRSWCAFVRKMNREGGK